MKHFQIGGVPNYVRWCVGCKREAPCHHNRDACVSQHLFAFSMGWADDPMVIERMEGRTRMLALWVKEKFGLEPDSLQSIATQDDGRKETSNGTCPDPSEV